LITSTILTLFVVPAVYTLLDDLATWFSSRRRVGHREQEASAGEAPALASERAGNPA
jgi:hypothetical protein